MRRPETSNAIDTFGVLLYNGPILFVLGIDMTHIVLSAAAAARRTARAVMSG